MKRDKRFILFNLGEDAYSWNGVFFLIAGYFGVLLVAALLTPLAYWGIQHMAECWPNDFTNYLASKHIRKVFDRLFYLPIILLIPIAIYALKLRSFKRFGLNFTPGGLFGWIKGFCFGASLLLGIILLHVLFGEVKLKTAFSFDVWFLSFAKVLLASAVIGFVEEILFRGLLLRLFYTAMRPLFAVIACSLFFAWVHFKMPGGIWDESGQAVSWCSGLFIAKNTLLGFIYDFDVVAFLNLFLLGCLLCIVYLRRGSLMPVMGIHSGVVLVTMLYKQMAYVDSLGKDFWLGSRILTDGLIPAIALFGVVVFLLSKWSKENSES